LRRRYPEREIRSSVLEDPPLLAAVRALGLDELGRSSEGRPIWGGCLGAASAEAPILVLGGVHGDEPSSVEAVVGLARRVAGGLRTAPLVLVPALNPDGLARGTKNSARDVDLNRNFPALNWRSDHQPGYFPGAAPLSEPESRLLAELVGRRAPRGVVAVHAPFACVNYDGPPPAAAWAEAVAAACGWPARADLGYPTPGSLGSWLGIDRGLPVLTLELPPGSHAAFSQQAAVALDAAVRAGAAGDPAL
jgi:protein MpaA